MKIAIAIRLANDPEFRHRVEEKPMGLDENEQGTTKEVRLLAGGSGD